jgi:cell division protein FtsL
MSWQKPTKSKKTGKSVKKETLSFRRVRTVTNRVILVFLFLGIPVGLPLITVWKQAYITHRSLANEDLADSLHTCRAERARLRAVSEQLSSAERIEEIAARQLGLQHPSPSRITVVEKKKKAPLVRMNEWKFWAFVKKSLEYEPEKG